MIGCAQEKFYVRSLLGDGFRAHKCAFEVIKRASDELEAVLLIAARHLEDYIEDNTMSEEHLRGCHFGGIIPHWAIFNPKRF